MPSPPPVVLLAVAPVQRQLAGVDYLILTDYSGVVLGIGWLLRKQLKTSPDFVESGRSLPAWICARGFIGTNLGAQKVMGMAASGAKYGIATSHCCWVGAVPASPAATPPDANATARPA